MLKIGDIIRTNRIEKRISQETLAYGICSVSNLSRIENGLQNPSRAKYEKLIMKMKFYCFLLIITILCAGCSDISRGVDDYNEDHSIEEDITFSLLKQNDDKSFFEEDEEPDNQPKEKSDDNSEEISMFTTPLLVNKLESENFIILFNDADISFAAEMLHNLIENRERILSFLQIEATDRAEIHIYPDIETFHIGAFGRFIPEYAGSDDDSPLNFTGVRGYYFDGVIKLLSPNHEAVDIPNEQAFATAIHEFVHFAAEQVNNNPPDYLYEGLATYLAGSYSLILTNEQFTIWINSLISAQIFPSVPLLRRLTYQYPAFHFISYLFADFIINEYGSEIYMELYRNPDLYEILGIGAIEIQDNWMEYLTNKYDL